MISYLYTHPSTEASSKVRWGYSDRIFIVSNTHRSAADHLGALPVTGETNLPALRHPRSTIAASLYSDYMGDQEAMRKICDGAIPTF